MRNDKKGNMGMGTLIIFIAMIIVAAIAASVLISTTTSLQNKALETGSQTKQEVGTSVTILRVFGEDGSNNSNVEDITTVLKLKAGSEPVRFNDTLISLGLDNASQSYTFNSTGTSSAYPGVNETFEDNGTASDGFFVNYSIEGENHVDGLLTTGDVAKVKFKSPRTIGESERFSLQITPKVGLQNSVETTTPTLIQNQRVEIYP